MARLVMPFTSGYPKAMMPDGFGASGQLSNEAPRCLPNDQPPAAGRARDDPDRRDARNDPDRCRHGQRPRRRAHRPVGVPAGGGARVLGGPARRHLRRDHRGRGARTRRAPCVSCRSRIASRATRLTTSSTARATACGPSPSTLGPPAARSSTGSALVVRAAWMFISTFAAAFALDSGIVSDLCRQANAA